MFQLALPSPLLTFEQPRPQFNLLLRTNILLTTPTARRIVVSSYLLCFMFRLQHKFGLYITKYFNIQDSLQYICYHIYPAVSTDSFLYKRSFLGLQYHYCLTDIVNQRQFQPTAIVEVAPEQSLVRTSVSRNIQGRSIIIPIISEKIKLIKILLQTSISEANFFTNNTSIF